VSEDCHDSNNYVPLAHECVDRPHLPCPACVQAQEKEFEQWRDKLTVAKNSNEVAELNRMYNLNSEESK
jgi:hypothetical protein